MARTPKKKSSEQAVRKCKQRNNKSKNRKKTRRNTFDKYVYRVLKLLHPDSRITMKAMSIMNSLLKDVLKIISTEAFRLLHYKKKSILTSYEIQTVSRLILPGEFSQHGTAEGIKAVKKYIHNLKKYKSPPSNT